MTAQASTKNVTDILIEMKRSLTVMITPQMTWDPWIEAVHTSMVDILVKVKGGLPEGTEYQTTKYQLNLQLVLVLSFWMTQSESLHICL